MDFDYQAAAKAHLSQAKSLVAPEEFNLIEEAVLMGAKAKEIQQEANNILRPLFERALAEKSVDYLNRLIDAFPSGWQRAKLMDRLEELSKSLPDK